MSFNYENEIRKREDQDDEEEEDEEEEEEESYKEKKEIQKINYFGNVYTGNIQYVKLQIN